MTPTAIIDNALAALASEKMAEMRQTIEFLKTSIRMMAEADEDSDSLGVQAIAKEALKR